MRRMVVAAICLTLVAGLAPGASAQAPPDKGEAPAAPSESSPPADDPAEGASGRRDARQERPSEQDLDELAANARRDGQVRAIVGLPVDFVPEGGASEQRRRNQRAEIAREQAAVRRDLAGAPHRVAHEYQTVPFMAVELSETAVQRLRKSGHVASVTLDEAVPPTLESSGPVVQSDLMADAGFTGTDKMVAVLDTGVDRAHSFLGGRVIEEACYSTTNAAAGSTTLCPNGSTSQTGTGAGVHCTGIASCSHGTHVAGIAAGSGASFTGVARNASIMSVQVFSRFNSASECNPSPSPCVRSWTSDQAAGLERVYALRDTHSFAAANMSLGGGRHTTNCDGDFRKTIIDNLASVDIATVISSGNSTWSDAVGAPGCISSAITVGSTTDGDAVSGFSNSHATMVDLYAPGSAITSSVPGGGFASFNGTSMAAPQVAGAWAALRHHRPTASVATLRSDLRNTGRVITDNRQAPSFIHSHPRIRVHSAAFGLPANSNMFADATKVTGTPKKHFQPTDGATLEMGEPQPCGDIGATVWYHYTPSTDGTATVDTFGSNYDTVLAAYTGSSVSGLTNVACNDDSGDSTWFLQSRVSFPVIAGQTYRLQLGGWDGRVGDARLNISGPPPEIPSAEFVPVAPCAVFDTRSAGIGFSGKLVGGATRTFQVTGSVPAAQGGGDCEAPPANAVAVQLNLVALNANAPGNLQIAAAGVAPVGGVVNFVAAIDNSNALPVEVSSSGAVAVTNNEGGGAVHVRGVVLGYYIQEDPAGLEFVAMAPCAVFDTRHADPGFAGRLAGGETRAFQVTGTVPSAQGGGGCPAPPANAVAVHLNLVAAEALDSGNLQIAAAGVVPQGGVVNFIGSVNNSNALPVAVNAGAVEVTTNGGAVHVRGVVLGYYIQEHPAGLAFIAVAPCAVFDTRTAAGALGGRLAGGTTRAFQVTGTLPAGQGGGGCQAPPAHAVAVELNLVAAEALDRGNLLIAEAGVVPQGGVVNFVAEINNSSALPVEVSAGGAVDVINNAGGGATHVRGVVLGYYVPAP